MVSRLFRVGEEGVEDAGKTEEVLQSFGIAIRESNNSFKSASAILTEIKAKWSDLTNVEKNYIAQTIGGKHTCLDIQ